MRIQLPTYYHRTLYVFGLMLTALGLPLSKFLISVSVFWIGINWLWEGNFKNKWQYFKSHPAILVVMGVFLIHLIGLLWSVDSKTGWNDLRIKLPLLLFPLVIGTSQVLTKKEVQWIMGAFLAAVFASAVSTIVVASGWSTTLEDNLRKASKFVSLIRLSLMVDLAIFWLGQSFFRPIPVWQKLAAASGIVWLFYFLVQMQSLTGLVILTIGSCILFICFVRFNQKRKLVVGIFSALLFVFLYAGTIGWKAWNQYYTFADTDLTHLDSLSASGQPYTHYPNNAMRENGHLVNIYLCSPELESVWNKRSKIAFKGGKTKNGDEVYYVLIRYMASKGLRKDSLGMQQMSATDIENVENGSCNAKWNEMGSLQQRLYQVFWEFDMYKQSGDASGKSVTMRFELAHNAMSCIAQRPLLGYGTGGTENAFRMYYEKNSWGLSQSYHWLHTHNQFLSIALTLGILVLIYFIFSLIYPMTSFMRWSNYFSIAFFIVIILSFLNDDTLETQQGATLFAFFNALVVFAWPHRKNPDVNAA